MKFPDLWVIYALLSAVFAALTTIFAKIGISGINANLATALRTTVVLVIAWGIAAAQGQIGALSEVSQKTLVFLGLSGIATGLSWIFYFQALQIGAASVIAPIDKLSVVFVLLFAAAFLGEPLGLRSLLGTFLIVAGTLVLVWAPTS